MDTVVIADRDLPEIRPASVTDGCDYRDALHLQVLTESGPPAVDLDCTDATWALMVSSEQGGTATDVSGAEIETWADSGVLVEDAETGYVHVVICATDVSALGPGTYWYQVTASLPAGHAYRPSWTQCLLAGTFTINPAATG